MNKRIIKFRAFDLRDEQMKQVYRICFDCQEVLFIDNKDYWVSYSKIHLMQFTERTDTNGIEIYDKDIVDYKGQQAAIEWQNEKWMCVSTNVLHVSIPLGSINGKDLKVIGNEYEGVVNSTGLEP